MLAKDSLKGQLEIADKLGVKYVLILGQKEVLEGTVLLRDMEGGVQENVDLDKIIPEVKKRLKEK
ncbi:MAG: His/Gly/Thr/Pro-type tRNA ligase C-terminal domain-containing protein [Patescibacteria group bacterium]|jgi:histidyl-tRNA synthetase